MIGLAAGAGGRGAAAAPGAHGKEKGTHAFASFFSPFAPPHWGEEMTGIIRFSWLTEQGAPSNSGTAEPEWDGFKVFCIEIFLPDRFLWRIYLKILPEIYQNNQRFSVILELHF